MKDKQPIHSAQMTLKTHFSAFIRRVALIITANKHTLSKFLTSFLSDYECHKTPSLWLLPLMTPADAFSQISILQKSVIMVFCCQKNVFMVKGTLSDEATLPFSFLPSFSLGFSYLQDHRLSDSPPFSSAPWIHSHKIACISIFL